MVREYGELSNQAIEAISEVTRMEGRRNLLQRPIQNLEKQNEEIEKANKQNSNAVTPTKGPNIPPPSVYNF